MYTVYEVFQSSGVPKYTRIEIADHNDRILGFLSTPGEHLIIHGPSKTGKSTLWLTQIGESLSIKIPCNGRTTLDSVYQDIIDELDVFFATSTTVSETIKASFSAEIKGKIIGILGGSAKADYGGERKKEEAKERAVAPVIGVRNISKYIKAAGKFIVLENIHYCSSEFRTELSKDLHNFSDSDCKFIIVGVQHQADQVFIENRDLVGRLREIKSGVFSKDQVRQIVEIGGGLLNVQFTSQLIDQIYRESAGYAALVQDIAKNACISAGVTSAQSETKILDCPGHIDRACTAIAESCAQVYSKFCDDIAKGGRSDNSTDKYKWFLKLVRDKEIPSHGLLNTEVFKLIQDLGHDDIAQGSVTQGLQYMNRLQQKRNITPPVLEYDQEKNRLFLLDPYFRFCLRWIPSLIESTEESDD
jgi:hypothetical protein